MVRFDADEIHEAVLSPNGRMVALTAGARSLWVVQLDGTDLRQVAPHAVQVFWGQNNQAMFYSTGSIEEGWVGIERVDISRVEITRVLTVPSVVPLKLLGWSPGAQWFYYILLRSEGGELWRVHQDDGASEFIVSLSQDLPLLPRDALLGRKQTSDRRP